MKPPSLYEYFPNKLAIYDALFLHGTHVFAGYMRNARQDNQSFWERTQAMIEAYMAFAHDHPELYQLVLERPVPGFVPSETSMVAIRTLLSEAVDDISAQLPHDAGIGDLTPEQVTDLINAVMHGLTALQMANEPNAPVGTGRFGSLIPAVIAMFRAAWSSRQPPILTDTQK
jgi:AcrR family transcriptional regulator